MISLASCSNNDESVAYENLPQTNSSSLEIKSDDESIANFWPVNKIAFFKVPKRDSLECKFGFGLCFRTVIVFGHEIVPEEPIEFDPETRLVSFAAEILNENKIRFHYPAAIVKSTSTNESSDFDNFEIPYDTTCAQKTKLKEIYPAEINTSGNLTADVEYIPAN
jgi:hypothetical protein